MTINKDRSITDLLSKLSYASRGWTLVDHWEADLFAIGLASDRMPGRLVYVSTYLKEPGRYFFECECVPPGAEATHYETSETGDNVDATSLQRVLCEWLGE